MDPIGFGPQDARDLAASIRANPLNGNEREQTHRALLALARLIEQQQELIEAQQTQIDLLTERISRLEIRNFKDDQDDRKRRW